MNTSSVELLKSCFLALRPKTLTAALVPCLAGSFLVVGLGKTFNLNLLLWALLSAMCIQIATNLVNDAEDFKKGADTKERVGPQRITASGILSFKQTYTLAILFFGFAIIFGIPLVVSGGWPIIMIGIFSVMMGYAYTGGPYPLAYKGLGDFFVILFFGVIATCGMSYLHSQEFLFEALWL